jgi:hypothetical protein
MLKNASFLKGSVTITNITFVSAEMENIRLNDLGQFH